VLILGPNMLPGNGVRCVSRPALEWVQSSFSTNWRSQIDRFFSGRYRVDDVMQDIREDCYLATLHINDADMADARPYYLVVENDRGTDRHPVTLRVEGMFSGAFH
jgi:hypothetical protein